MKNRINISLTIFVIFLILFQEGKSFSSNTLIKNVISKTDKLALTSNVKITENLEKIEKSQDKKKDKKKKEDKKKEEKKKKKEEEKDDDRKSMPTFINKGFKCMSYKPTTTLVPQYCANPGQVCTSKGVVMMGPMKDGSFAVVVTEDEKAVKCESASFGSKEGSSGKRCFTHKTLDPDIADKDKEFDTDEFSHRVCIRGDTEIALINKQGDKLKCDEDTFGKDTTGPCACYKAAFPMDESLTSFFYPVRLNKIGEFQCISANKKFCGGFKDEDECRSEISKGKIEDDNIIKADKELMSTLFKYFFNRWICPAESGLKVAVMYENEKKENNYNISCLSKDGQDCLQEDNAQAFCSRVIICKDTAKKAKKLQCASKEFQTVWGYTGFNNQFSTWCKSANSWLRFDSTVEITKTAKKIGLVLLPNGMSGCIPSSTDPKECLIENKDNLLRKTIDTFLDKPNKFADLVRCQGKILGRTRNNPEHWCSNSIISPEETGKLNYKIAYNLFVTVGKKSKTGGGGMQMANESFTKAESWQDYFATITKTWGQQDSYPRYLEDVNGDGTLDIIGFGLDGVYVSIGVKDGSFLQSKLWNNNITIKEYDDDYPKHIADINKDGKADIVVFGKTCIEVSYSDGEKFGDSVCAFKNFTKESGGWNVNKHLRFVTDINGDGFPDIVGFGQSSVFLLLNEEGSFKKVQSIFKGFTIGSGGWKINNHPRFIEDVNGDGCKDIVGVGNDSVFVALGTENCTKWESAPKWTDEFTYKRKKWRPSKNPVWMVDVNNDGKMDIVGFKESKIYIEISTGKKFTKKKNPQISANSYNYKKNVLNMNHHISFKDVNGDTYPDIVFVGKNKILVGLNDQNDSFKSPTTWGSDILDDDGYAKNTTGTVFVQDLDKNQLADIIAIGHDGVHVALNNTGKKYEKKKYSTGSFSNGVGNKNGYIEDKHDRFFTDVNGDGLPDAVAYTDAGILVNINLQTNFQGDRIYTDNMTGGWSKSETPRHVIDLNKDGLADIIGFGKSETEIYFNDGENFGSKGTNKGFSDGWSTEDHFRDVVDMNNDGYPDIIGCHDNETFVGINNKKGNFDTAKSWGKNFNKKQGWSNQKHLRIMADINGDGFTDIVGFGEKGVYVGVNNDGKNFDLVTMSSEFGSEDDWSLEHHPRFIVDVNGDKLPDIVGFGSDGVYVALNVEGKKFEASAVWSKEFGMNSGWLGTLYKRYMVDINQDGMADIVAFGKNGVQVSFSDGKKFSKPKEWTNFFGNSDNAGDWTISDLRQIKDMNGDGFPDIVGIKDDKILIALNRLK